MFGNRIPIFLARPKSTDGNFADPKRGLGLGDASPSRARLGSAGSLHGSLRFAHAASFSEPPTGSPWLRRLRHIVLMAVFMDAVYAGPA